MKRMLKVVAFFVQYFLRLADYVFMLAVLLLTLALRGFLAPAMSVIQGHLEHLGLEGVGVAFSLYLLARVLYASMPTISPVAQATPRGRAITGLSLVVLLSPFALAGIHLLHPYTASYAVSVLVSLVWAVSRVLGPWLLLAAVVVLAPLRPIDALAVLLLEILAGRDFIAVIRLGREAMSTASWHVRALAMLFAALVVLAVTRATFPDCACRVEVKGLLSSGVYCPGDCPSNVSFTIIAWLAGLYQVSSLVLVFATLFDTYLDWHLRYLYAFGRRVSLKPLATLALSFLVVLPLLAVTGFSPSSIIDAVFILSVSSISLWLVKPDVYTGRGVFLWFVAVFLLLLGFVSLGALLVGSLGQDAALGVYSVLAAFLLATAPWVSEYARLKLGM